MEKRGLTGKKGVGDTLEGGDTRVKAIKSDKAMSKKKVVSFCEEEIRGDTAELPTKKRSPGFSGKNRGASLNIRTLWRYINQFLTFNIFLTLSCRPGCHPP